MLDLTFNDDIMLDTLENNYISTGYRTVDKGVVNQLSDSMNASPYSPISDDESHWSSVDSHSSPEGVEAYKRQKKIELEKTVTTLCGKPTETPVKSGGKQRANNYCFAYNNYKNTGAANLLMSAPVVSRYYQSICHSIGSESHDSVFDKIGIKCFYDLVNYFYLNNLFIYSVISCSSA